MFTETMFVGWVHEVSDYDCLLCFHNMLTTLLCFGLVRAFMVAVVVDGSWQCLQASLTRCGRHDVVVKTERAVLRTAKRITITVASMCARITVMLDGEW